MKTIRSLLVITTLLGTGALFAAEEPASPTATLARGRYLVQNIGLCADCHSPRNERGQFIAGMELKGSPLAFAPTVPMPAWGAAAPAIAGLPTMTVAQAEHFMQTGEKPDGSKPRPPMPEFRFNAEDARAVVAYLKSLK